jgi:hypothetical protein
MYNDERVESLRGTDILSKASEDLLKQGADQIGSHWKIGRSFI